jgi:hypothetical protein
MTKLIGNGQLKGELKGFTIVYTTNIKECEYCAVCPRCQKAYRTPECKACGSIGYVMKTFSDLHCSICLESFGNHRCSCGCEIRIDSFSMCHSDMNRVRNKSGVNPDWIQEEKDRDEIIEITENQKKVDLAAQQNIKVDNAQRLEKITRRFITLSEENVESLTSSRLKDFKLISKHIHPQHVLVIEFKLGWTPDYDDLPSLEMQNYPYNLHNIEFNVTNNTDIGEIVYRVDRVKNKSTYDDIMDSHFIDYTPQKIRRHTVNFSISKMSQITDGEIYELFRICIFENYFFYIKIYELFKKYITG